MKVNKIKNKIFYVVVIGISIIVFLFLIGVTWIGHDVKAQCKDATAKYGGNCVYALSALLDDENNSFRERNSAIWALGELGDRKALPVLKKYYTGNIPEREPLNKMISQYELKKAIALCEGGTNITGVFWRSDDLYN